MSKSLSLDPTVTQKRLGDGFYEQKLIREQVAELTGRRFLADFRDDEQEYKALMNSDIVWLVEQTVTLPDGSGQKVLVPQVYRKLQSVLNPT
jgi:filamentous hemagglutinin